MGKMSLWFNKGRMVFNQQGKLVFCDHCPCECKKATDCAARFAELTGTQVLKLEHTIPVPVGPSTVTMNSVYMFGGQVWWQ